jgi:hypothetical protein
VKIFRAPRPADLLAREERSIEVQNVDDKDTGQKRQRAEQDLQPDVNRPDMLEPAEF